MNQELLNKVESAQLRKEPLEFNVGDSVKVHTKVVEGEKERIQVFAGLVIGRRGHGMNETFTVRRISYGEGVERVFPVHSPRIDKVVVDRQGKVRRARDWPARPWHERDVHRPAHQLRRRRRAGVPGSLAAATARH